MKKIFFFFGAVALICSCSAPKATSYSYSEYINLFTLFH